MISLEPMRQQVQTHKETEAEPLVTAFAAQGLVTNQVLHQRGYDIDPKCPKCKEAVDGIVHRALFCTHPEVVKARKEGLPLRRQEAHKANIKAQEKETSLRARLLWEKGMLMTLQKIEDEEQELPPFVATQWGQEPPAEGHTNHQGQVLCCGWDSLVDPICCTLSGRMGSGVTKYPRPKFPTHFRLNVGTPATNITGRRTVCMGSGTPTDSCTSNLSQ